MAMELGMGTGPSLEVVEELLDGFARRTGLTDPRVPPRRYLWTDAFAVCAYLGVHRATGRSEPLELAARLVSQVHEVLGRHRPDDPRQGWLSGLPEEAGRVRPTVGGLRIGKPLPERRPEEPYDEELEWQRDGQYFHYSTKWMHALARLGEVTGEARYLSWAIDLARASYAGFCLPVGRTSTRRLVWKASVDLSRPLVPSTGQHDALDGLVTFAALRHASARAGRTLEAGSLEHAITELRDQCRAAHWATEDPLGLGELLVDVHRLARLASQGEARDAGLVPRLLADATAGLALYLRAGGATGSAARRLAFRELGLSLGLHAVGRLVQPVEGGEAPCASGTEARRWLAHLRSALPVAREIEGFWLDPAARSARTWRDHLDIDEVMLAASLLPEGYLGDCGRRD